MAKAKIRKTLHNSNKVWISKAIKHPGELHKELGVKAGHKISVKKLDQAEKKGGKIAKRAILAKTLRSLNG